MSSISSDEETFDWNKYLMLRNAEEVPESFFFHICKSEMNGIELGSIIEVENEDHSGYWYASVCSSTGVLIRLHYLGDENDNHDFELEVRSSRIHPINWGRKNNKKQSPPHPDRFSRVNLKLIQEKVKNCEHIISNAVLQMKGAPIYNIFKPEMFVEIQDIDYPYSVWISKVIKNVGGRLLLQKQGAPRSNEPFWLFYSNKRVFPLGWADQKGIPWRLMNSNKDIKNNNNNSSLLLNVLKPKTPERHSYKVGEMLEVLNPYSLMVFHVATIVRTYDNHYFKVEVDNEYDIKKRLTFWATKENPYLFNAGWASKHKFLLKPPSDWNKPYTFSWSEYILMKNSKLAVVDNKPTKKNDYVRVGMKLEAVDPIQPNRIRVATVKGFADHWMFLTFDRTNWRQELLHVRSIYSDNVFPVGWCNKHKYQLSVPRLPYTDNNNFDHYYYVSEVETEFNKSDNVSKYFKGEIPYHYSEKDHKKFDDDLEESLQNVFNDNNVQCGVEMLVSTADSNTSKNNSELHILTESKMKAKTSSSDLCNLGDKSEYFKKTEKTECPRCCNKKYNPKLKSKLEGTSARKAKRKANSDVFTKSNNSTKKETLHEMISKCAKETLDWSNKSLVERYKYYLASILYFETHMKKSRENFTEPDQAELAIIRKIQSKKCDLVRLDEIDVFDCTKTEIYNENTFRFNKSWKDSFQNYYNTNPKYKEFNIDIGHIEQIQVMSNPIDWSPSTVFEYLSSDHNCKRIALKLYDEHVDGVALMLLTDEHLKNRLGCDLSLMIRFMCHIAEVKYTYLTFYDTPDPCLQFDPKLKSKLEGTSARKAKRKANSDVFTKSNNSTKKETLHEMISKCAKETLDWSNKSLVERYKYYLASILYFETHMKKSRENFTEPDQAELAIIRKIQSKKCDLVRLDEIDVFDCTKTEIYNENTFRFNKSWKDSFQNYYNTNPKYKEFNIDIGHIEQIQVMSNPIDWSPSTVFEYLSSDHNCKRIALKLYDEHVDGVALMLLTDEHLKNRLGCDLSLMIRFMCHIAEVKYTYLTFYDTPDPCLQFDPKLKSKLEGTSARKAKRKANSDVFTKSNNSTKKETLHEMISKCAKETLDWSNKSLVERYKYYLASILYFETHMKKSRENFTEPDQAELAIIRKIQSKKCDLVRLDEIDVFDCTKTEIYNENTFRFNKSWKDSFQNYYNTNPKYKEFNIDIGHIEQIQVMSNPIDWSPSTVFEYLSSDHNCKRIALKLYDEHVDGVALMLLTDEHLKNRLGCDLSLMIRFMCHIAEVKYTYLTFYDTPDPCLQFDPKLKSKLEGTSARKAKRKANSDVFTKSNNSTKKETLHEMISKCAKETLDWSNKSLVERYKYYLASILYFETHMKKSRENFTEPDQAELAIIRKIQSKKCDLVRLDEIDVFDCTKTEIYNENTFRFNKSWKDSFQNYYNTNPKYKEFNIDIGHIEQIQVMSNPIDWSPSTVFEYLSSDHNCKRIALKLYDEHVDGVALMLLTDEHLKNRLGCDLSLMIRFMCHIAEVKYTYLTFYDTPDPCLQFDPKLKSKLEGTSARKAKRKANSDVFTKSNNSTKKETLHEMISKCAKETLDWSNKSLVERYKYYLASILYFETHMKKSRENFTEPDQAELAIIRKIQSKKCDLVRLDEIDVFDCTKTEIYNENTFRFNKSWKDSFQNYYNTNPKYKEFNIDIGHIEQIQVMSNPIDWSPSTVFEYLSSDHNCKRIALKLYDEHVDGVALMLLTDEHLKNRLGCDLSLMIRFMCHIAEVKYTYLTFYDTPDPCLQFDPKLKSKLEGTSARKAKRKANSDVFTKSNNSTKKETLHEMISKCAKETLDWSNKSLVERYKYYLASILYFETHMKKSRENFTEPDQAELAIIRKIQSKKCDLVRLDEIDVFDCTKTEIYNENTFRFNKSWKDSFQNYYNTNPKYKEFNIDIGHIEQIQVMSNPIDWSPSTVFEYLSSDHNCKRIALKLYDEHVDGVALMLLTDEHLKNRLGCDLSLMIRFMCHIAEVKYTYLTFYDTPDPCLQFDPKLKSKLEGTSARKAKRKANSDVFTKSNNSTKKETLHEMISKCAKETLDWSNKSLVERYKYYLASILYFETHMKKSRENFTEPDQAELAIIRKIQSKKCDLVRLDEIYVFDCTKTEIYNENTFRFNKSWKDSFQNYYNTNPKYKEFNIDIGHIEQIQVMSNPIDWSPSTVFEYLSSDHNCKRIALKLYDEHVDGVALMLLTDEHLKNRLGCDLSLMIRFMCHIAEVKYTYLTFYDTPDPCLQFDPKLKSKLEGTSARKAKRKANSDVFTKSNNSTKKETLHEMISKCAKETLDWSNKSLVERYKYYLASILYFETHMKKSRENFTEPDQAELAIIRKIQSKKCDLVRLDEIDVFDCTKTEIYNENTFRFNKSWKDSFQNYYNTNPKYKEFNIDIGHIEQIQVMSNPIDWSPSTVFEYLSSDHNCKRIALKLYDEHVDGVALMLLTDEHLKNRLGCDLSLMIRFMCHIAEVKYTYLTFYDTPDPCLQFDPKLKSKLEGTSARKAKRKANSDVFTKSNNSTKKETLHEMISKCAKETLDWSNKSLVERYKYYLASILYFETHMKKSRENFTEPDQAELAIIRKIQSKKCDLVRLDEIDVFDCTKTEIYNENTFRFNKSWKDSFQNYYNTNPKYKEFNIDIGHIEQIQVMSNPIDWSPSTVFEYLSSDHNCKRIALKLYDEHVDGVALMLLTDEHLKNRLGCDLSLMIRFMCHIAEVKYTYLTFYDTPDPCLQFDPKLKSKLEGTSARKAKRKANSDVFTKSNNSTKKETLHEMISKCAKETLDWSNKSLVERYKYYLASILYFETHMKKSRENFTEPDQAELAIIRKIQSKKCDLVRLDEIDVFDCTKTEIYNENTFRFNKSWKDSFQNYYNTNPKYKEFNIDIGHIEQIQVMSNPIDWSPSTVFEYLSSDHNCKRIALKLYDEHVDGVALMLLTDEHLKNRLGCDLSLMIRFMCHIAEVKYTYLTFYDTPDPCLQFDDSVAHGILEK